MNMKSLNDVGIAGKIIGLIMLLGIVTGIVVWNGSSSIRSNDTAYNALIEHRIASTRSLNLAARSLYEMNYRAYQTLAYEDMPSMKRAAGQEQAAFDQAMRLMAEAQTNNPAIADDVARFTEQGRELQAIIRRGVAAGMRNDNDQARTTLTESDALMDRLGKAIVDFNAVKLREVDAESDVLSAGSATTVRNLIVTAIIAIAAAIGLALLVTRKGITGPLTLLRDRMREIAAGNYGGEVQGVDRGDEIGAMAQAVQVFRGNGIAKDAADRAKAQADADQKLVVDTVSSHLSDLSDGDLTATITQEFPSDYAALKSNFNDAVAKLRDLIGSVSESATAIRTGSGEIAQASEDLARRTESNAASLEETAASVTQMDGRLRASAAAATRTVERADQAIATVGGGRSVADEAVQAMGRVSDSAKGIDSVIEGLDKIAFQTRVLAMNAAVEAGRAGDAGRGFAVVADLVSALAMRAEEEAKRARDQLTVTQTDIVTAVEAVTKVDGALANISGDVAQVHELLASMAADNQAQSAAITQISAAIGTMDQSTQQNAAMVEETSAAARNLAGEVRGLTEQADRFRIHAAGSAGPVRHAPPRRDYAKPDAYVRPVAAPAMAHAGDEWTSF
jgi:methyl-accepting chemotaxis protein